MFDVATNKVAIPVMSDVEIAMVRELETEAMKLPQVRIEIDHVLHAGMYSRTAKIPAGVLITGVLIKVPTTLVLSGDATMFVGAETIRLRGYHVIPSEANRKQAFVAHEDTYLTMSFPSAAQTVDEAEAEFTDEVDLLTTRR